MSLPSQQYKMFSITVPSTKKQVSFRAYTVREERLLVIAKETEDTQTIINTVKECIKNCFSGLDVDSLTMFDIEYLLTNLRAKSMGEYIDLNMSCDNDHDHPKIPVRIDLTKIEVKVPKNHSRDIHLYDDVHIMMKYPTIDNLMEMEKSSNFDAIIMCIESIYNSNEVFRAADSTKEELTNFIDALSTEQFNKIKTTFFETIPVFEFDLTYTCSKCGQEHNKKIRGLSNFFI